MKKFGLKYGILLLSLLLCLLPAVVAYADDTVTGSFTVVGNEIILAVGNPTYTSLTLTWHSPETMFGCGPATQYDIRYSIFPITNEAAWQAATQVANPPTPGPPGSTETLMVIGLNPCTVYYFAIKACDDCGTWTPLSNSPQGTTLCLPNGGGGGGGSIAGDINLGPTTSATCPLTLTVNMQGNITTARMTNDGVLCETCLANDAANQYTLEIDKDTKLILAGSEVPRLMTFRDSSTIPQTTENTVIVGQAYDFNAYPSTHETTPSPITISPSARLLLSYDPEDLPDNTTEVFIANYDTNEGWLPLTPVPGAVAEVGKAHGMLGHFSLFAVIAKIQEPAPAKFEISKLTVSPDQVHINQEITISVDVANTGGKTADYNLEMKVDGKVNSTTQLTIAPGASQVVNFTLTGDSVGKHQVEIAGLVGEFEVIKSATTSLINWWLIGIITAMVLAIWAILGWRWFKDRKTTAPVTAASTEKPTDKSAE